MAEKIRWERKTDLKNILNSAPGSKIWFKKISVCFACWSLLHMIFQASLGVISEHWSGGNLWAPLRDARCGPKCARAKLAPLGQVVWCCVSLKVIIAHRFLLLVIREWNFCELKTQMRDGEFIRWNYNLGKIKNRQKQNSANQKMLETHTDSLQVSKLLATFSVLISWIFRRALLSYDNLRHTRLSHVVWRVWHLSLEDAAL